MINDLHLETSDSTRNARNKTKQKSKIAIKADLLLVFRERRKEKHLERRVNRGLFLVVNMFTIKLLSNHKMA